MAVMGHFLPYQGEEMPRRATTERSGHLGARGRWFRPGYLRGAQGDSYDRVRLARRKEQTKLDVMKLNPQEIHNTQKTVNRTFSNGGCVLKTLVDLVLGRPKKSDLPMIRVACHEELKQ